MKSFSDNHKNGKKTGWVSIFVIASAVFFIMLIAVFPLLYALSVIPPAIIPVPAAITPVTVVALLGVGFFLRRMIMYAASFPRRVEMVRMIYRETQDINEIHLMHSSASDKFFSWIVRVCSATGALFCLEDVSDYADRAVMSIVRGAKRRNVLFCNIWLSATRIKNERGEEKNPPVKDIFCGTSALPVPGESYDNDGPPKGYSVYALRMALDSLYHDMKINGCVDPRDMQSLFYAANHFTSGDAPYVLHKIKGRLEFYDSVRGDWRGRYNIGGESPWSDGLKYGHLRGEKIDWVPPDIRAYSPTVVNLMRFAKGLRLG